MFAGRPIIGLAGGIGAGKSYVARLFEAAGCCRIASDEMVRAAYTHPAVKRAVVERFGEEVLDDGGRINRQRIARVVFRDADQRRWLERLLHPVANQARVQVMEQAANDTAVLAYVWDSPLLYETKLNELCDTVVFVDTPEADRLKRVAERGWDAQELHRRENVQIALDKKRELADYRICNAEASPVTAERVRALLVEILERFGAGESAGCGADAAVCGAAGGCCRCHAGSVAQAADQT